MPTPSKRAFEQFYKDHIDKVYRFVYFRCGGNKEQAEDLVGEIFMKALEHFDGYDKKISTSAWIMTITRNHLINHWRDTKPTLPLPEAVEEEENGGGGDSFWLEAGLRSWQQQETKQEIYQLLANLSEGEREIVTLHYLIGYSYLEIAELKGLTEGAVKVAAHRALKKLRSQL